MKCTLTRIFYKEDQTISFEYLYFCNCRELYYVKKDDITFKLKKKKKNYLFILYEHSTTLKVFHLFLFALCVTIEGWQFVKNVNFSVAVELWIFCSTLLTVDTIVNRYWKFTYTVPPKHSIRTPTVTYK
jgi:hypothetical protein